MTTKKEKLPPRVIKKHGIYYYIRHEYVGGKRRTRWIRLGRTLEDMYRSLADLESDGSGLVAVVFQRYRAEILPKKAANTQKAQGAQLDRLAKAFGHMRPADIRPRHIAQYHDLVGKDAPYQANRELALITHVLKYAVRWGCIDENPAREIQRHPEAPRDRYITDAEYTAVRAAAPEWVGILMDLAYLTGQRRVDLLSLQRSQITPEGLYIRQSKTGTQLLLEWTDDLRSAVQRALDAQTVQSVYILCDNQGQKRKDAAFTSAWGRLITKCIEEGVIDERFQFRDIRAKAGSDSDGDHLGHRSKATLQRHYKRLPARVKPTQ